jgi:hypothetical protein
VRKRLLIGAIAVAYVLSQPKKGTVEWHQKEYLRYSKGPRLERVVNFVKRGIGMQPIYRGLPEAQMEREREHRRALIDLGYLVESELVLSNQTVDKVLSTADQLMRRDPRSARLRMDFLHFEYTIGADITPGGANTFEQTNKIVVVAHREDFQFIAEAIRQADVPASK